MKKIILLLSLALNFLFIGFFTHAMAYMAGAILTPVTLDKDENGNPRSTATVLP